MGEQILIMASLVAFVDTLSRAFLPPALKLVLHPALADSLGSGLATIAIYMMMAIVLVWKPRGLFPQQ